MQSRDYNLLVGMIEMLSPEMGIKLYGKKVEELEDFVRRLPYWACPFILLWFCKLLQKRTVLIGSSEYIEMDKRFLEEGILDKIAQSQLGVATNNFLKAAQQLRAFETEPASFEHGTRLLANSCGFRLPQTGRIRAK